MKKGLDEGKIVALLRDLDRHLKEPCRIVICGGAAAIVGYGLRRFTGDVDILEVSPKGTNFFGTVKELSEKRGLDPHWANDGAKGFIDYLSPGFRNRLVPLDAGFKKLDVYFLGKADLVTMKICAWREADKDDIAGIGLTKDDLRTVDENLAYLETHSRGIAHKAHLVLSELGLRQSRILESDQVTSLAALILFYTQRHGRDPTLEEIVKWKDRMNRGTSPAVLARNMERHN